ncbi:MAG TPA: hypothetical protein VK778_11230 [Solirubrobacteraceae bacterium]|jgi:hypothetical protein|nr:hypothetical protein [Solirubrobacteraceae bacterium]
MLRVRIALALGLGITVVAVAVVLSSSPPALLATNSVAESTGLSETGTRPFRICQGDERLPRGTDSIQASLEAYTGPRLTLTAYAAGRVVTSGELAAGWSGRAVPISVGTVRRTLSPVTVCLTATLVDEPLQVVGSATSAARAARGTLAQPIGGRIRLVYLGAGRASWLARARSVARNMEFGRAWSGAWIAPVLVLLMLVAASVASALVLSARE